MLESLQGQRPEHVEVLLGNGDQVRLSTNDYFYYYKNLKHRFLQAHQTFSVQNRPNPADSNSWGSWSNHAEELLKQTDHLCQIATITKSQVKKLNKAGIDTMLGLIETDHDRIKGMNTLLPSKRAIILFFRAWGQCLLQWLKLGNGYGRFLNQIQNISVILSAILRLITALTKWRFISD